MKRRTVRGIGMGLLLAATCLVTHGSPAALAAPPGEMVDDWKIDRYERALDAWELEEARVMAEKIADSVQRELRLGILETYEADYASAEKRLALLIASGAFDHAPGADRAQRYLQLARGAQVALADAVTITSEDGRFEAVFADPRDQILAPYLFEALAKAYDELGVDIGVRPDHKIRFEFLDDPAKLALVTPLALENIYTTGTVGITKYRRVMMVTPRVMLYGYGWLDTAVHEYVHYLVTIRTQNEAPVWLQEGLAKLLETRWRLDTAPALDPPIAGILNKAIRTDELVTLEQMHPSVAMLPTQEMAALAYAEVQTMLELLRDERGPQALHAVMDEVARGIDARDALAHAWGGEFDDFLDEWKRVYERKTKAGGGSLDERRFTDPDASEVDPSLLGDAFSHLGGGKARQHARLGVLLTLRGHKQAAALEYEKARKADPRVKNDPKLARRLGELYLELDRADEAAPLLDLAVAEDPDNANLAAAQGRARLRMGDPGGARESLERAIRVNPFIPSLHCDLAELTEDREEQRREQALCHE